MHSQSSQRLSVCVCGGVYSFLLANAFLIETSLLINMRFCGYYYHHSLLPMLAGRGTAHLSHCTFKMHANHSGSGSGCGAGEK